MEQTDNETGSEQKVTERIQRQEVPIIQVKPDFIYEYQLKRTS